MASATTVKWCLYFLMAVFVGVLSDGILFPQESEKRQLINLDALWNFRVGNTSNPSQGFSEQWYSRPLQQSGDTILMPVPSSYNDVTQEVNLRDYFGWVWYDREFFVADNWNGNSVFVRIGSANYHTIVWFNGYPVAEHSGGYLPFQADVTTYVNFGGLNRITVAVNNTLTDTTLPQGAVTYFNNTVKYPTGYVVLSYNFDFFNYAGIHRPVYIYTVSRAAYVDDIEVTTTRPTSTSAIVKYSIAIKGGQTSSALVEVRLYDKNQTQVVQALDQPIGLLSLTNPHLWWARGMGAAEVGYLYTLHVQVKDRTSGALYDSYRLRIGIREVKWSSNRVSINDVPVYFKGFGRHEDTILRGRGFDRVTLVKDFNLMRWTGANSFRTSHYPYSEELMDLADEQGFMVIDEVPAVAVTEFSDALKANHIQTLRELYNRDKNRPSVVMWSVANEPDTSSTTAAAYFTDIAASIRSLDSFRPVTLVSNTYYSTDLVGQLFDVICLNRYNGWYTDAGALELVTYQLVNELTLWRQKYGKPIIVTEYGADTISGLHQDPSFVWTEDYQLDLMTQYFAAFDDLARRGFLIGEMIWNFADFATKQDISRAVVNRKGIFTRERQPKASARHLKQRYER